MNKFIMSLMLTVSAVFAFPFQSVAQTLPNENGEVIEVTVKEVFSENGSGRDLGTTPITATLFRLSGYVEVEFLNYLGVVTITLNNLTTGGTSTMQINSTFGEAVIPVSLGAGNYRIDFSSSYGNYYGFFIVN